MSLKLSIAVSGYSKASAKLERLMAIAKRPLVPAQQAAVWLAGQTLLAFSEGGRPEKWAPLSMMTLFIRAHREGPKNKTALPMNDTGRLKGSFIPVVGDDGATFGASTNVAYAQMMQDGGKTEASEVSIAGFTRKLRSRQATAYSKGKVEKLQKSTVKPYVIHFKGGSLVPARPFFPEGISQLNSWGYHDKIKEIFRNYFREATA